jgi:hypothetical protein
MVELAEAEAAKATPKPRKKAAEKQPISEEQMRMNMYISEFQS